MSGGKWDWSTSLWASDSRQTTVYCLGWSVDEVLPNGQIGIEAVPLEGQTSLADKFRLDRNEFREWAKFVKTVKTGDGVEIYLSIERIWLNWMDWDWSENHAASDDRQQVITSYLGDRLNGELLRKLRRNHLTFDDLSERARTSLADKVKLDVREIKFWCRIEKVEEKSDSFIIFAAIPKVWFNSTRTDDWNWKDDGYNHDKSLKYLTCKGKAISRNVIEAVESESSSRDLIPEIAWYVLASAVGLDASQVNHWGQDFSYSALSTGLKVRIGVPNVWICADLLQGGNLADHLIFGTGGYLGQIPSHLSADKKVIFCRDFNEFLETIEKNADKLWGFVMFAHGNPLGAISATRQGSVGLANQSELILLIKRCIKYKLAKVYAMQCTSGYKGVYKIEARNVFSDNPERFSQSKNKDYREVMQRCKSYFSRYLSDWVRNIQVFIEDDQIMISFDVNWLAGWDDVAICVFTYQGTNVLSFDTAWIGIP